MNQPTAGHFRYLRSGDGLAIHPWAPLAGAFAVLLILAKDNLEQLPPAPLVGLFVLLSATLTFSAYRAGCLNKLPFLDPGSLLTSAFFLRYAVGSAMVFAWPLLPWRSRHLADFYDNSLALQNLSEAAIIAMIGAIGLFCGSAVIISTPPKHSSTEEPLINALRTLGFPIALVCFGIAVFIEPRVSLSILNVIHVPAAFAGVLIGLFAYFAASERDAYNRWTWILICAVCYGLAVIPGIRSGMREHFVKPLMMIVMGYVLARRRIPWLALGTGILSMLLVGLPILNRAKQLSVQTDLDGIERLEEASAEVGRTTDRSEAVEFAVANALIRMNLIPFASVFSAHYPEQLPFLMGETFALEATSFIPRVLWPDKPELSKTLDEYSRQVGIINIHDVNTSAKFDGLSEYFINFGAWGVFFLKFLEGVYYRLIHVSLLRALPSILATVITGFLIMDNGDSFGFIMLLPSHIQSLIVWGIMLSLVWLTAETPRIPSLSFATTRLPARRA